MKVQTTIGVLIGNANSPYSMELMRGIHAAAQGKNIHLIFYIGIHNNYTYKSYFGEDSSDDYDYQNNVIYDYTQFCNIDALIVAYGSLGIFMEKNDRKAFLEKFEGIPYVLLGDYDETGKGSSIITDNYRGMCEIVEHLVLGCGYKNITYLAGPEGNRDADERNQAVRDIMNKYQIVFDENRIAYGDFSQCVEAQIETLFEKHPDMEAMICANDFMADTVYRICKKKGLVVGKDLAVTGYDNWENAGSMTPPLTTVEQDAFKLGEITIQAALELINGAQPKKTIVPAKILIRESSGVSSQKIWIQNKLDFSIHSRIKQIIQDIAAMLKKEKDAFANFQQEAWFIPLISRDMMAHLDNETDFFKSALQKLTALHIQSAGLFVFRYPITHKRKEDWNLSADMFLVSFMRNGEVKSYELNDAPVLSRTIPLNTYFHRDGNLEVAIFCLYSGEKQYGVLVMEMEPDNLSIAYLISMQIANALHYYALFGEQKRTQKELKSLVKQIKDKNQVLNFISEYDALTNCLNRRGFMERAMVFNRNNAGKEAILVFVDVDHLKEINDTFGHIEGDFAITECANILKKCAENNGIIGRIGGDEFVLLALLPDEISASSYIEKLREEKVTYNKKCTKPYYVDFSIGSKQITLCANLLLTNLLKEADQELYAAKLHRRKSAIKE